MKTIALITDSVYRKKRLNKLGKTLKNNIEEVFGDHVLVNNYYLDSFTADLEIREDLTIVMAESRAIKVKDYVINKNSIIVASRTFMKNAIMPLYSIPEGADVLVVNDTIETVLESVSTLNHTGINHLNFIPFESDKDYHHINYAISPYEPELVPSYIENVYDVTDRVLDISTMLLIISKLNLNDLYIQKKIYNYYQKVLNANDGIIDNYNSLLEKTEEIDILLNLSHDGILLTDSDGRILVSNKTFKQMFNLTVDIKGQFIHELIPDFSIKKYYIGDFSNELITYKKRYINLEKKDIIHFNNKKRMYFNFQEVTYIKKLEQNLTQKLRQKGQIARYDFSDIVRQSKKMETIINICKKIAPTDLTVFITGESGTGKEVLAQAIHNASERRNQPFIAINGAAIPDNLMESELFGYVSGSFTGALKGGKQGLFEKANNGTIFLDEIGDMPNYLQSKLLRVLQEQQITPIGSDQMIDIDVRVIAATHRDPNSMITDGSFRKDLFYRLNVFPVHLPPLRDRIEDFDTLLHHFTDHRFDFTEECMAVLHAYDWPGNIRELLNIAQYLSVLEDHDIIDLEALPMYLTSGVENGLRLSISKESFKKETLILDEKTDFQTAFRILENIQLLNDIKKTAGRKHLLELFEKEGTPLTENYLRKSLLALEVAGLIIIKKGRNGSYITNKGRTFLKNRIE